MCRNELQDAAYELFFYYEHEVVSAFSPRKRRVGEREPTRLIALTRCLMQHSAEAVEPLLAQFGLHRDFFARAL